MKSTDSRDLILVPIASQADSEYIRTIPTAQTTSGDGSVSMELGFPPECAISVAAGGKRPEMKDVNGVYNLLSSAIQSLQSYFGTYSADLSTAIGGYPLNAIVADSATAGVFWVSTDDNNTTVPGASGASWQSLFTGLQTSLGFTPVQQGGGPNQTADKICIGADSTGIGGIRYALMNGTVLTDQGFILRSYAPNPAVGDVAFTNIYYAGGVGHVWAAISDTIYGSLAWLADVTTVQTNLTTALAAQSSTNADVQTQLAAKLPSTAPNPAGGDVPLTDLYYAGDVSHVWAAISDSINGSLAWLSDVTTVQTQMATLVSGAPQVSTDAQGIKIVYAAGSTSPDGTARPRFYYNGGNAFLATTADTATLTSNISAVSSSLTSEIATRSDQVSDLTTQVDNRIVGLAGSGFITVQSLVVDENNQSLALNLGNGVVAQEYARSQYGTIAASLDSDGNGISGGTWTKIGNVLRQTYEIVHPAGEGVLTFPMAFSEVPRVSVSSTDDSGNLESVIVNVRHGTITTTQFTLFAAYYAGGSTGISGSATITVTAEGIVS